MTPLRQIGYPAFAPKKITMTMPFSTKSNATHQDKDKKQKGIHSA